MRNSSLRATAAQVTSALCAAHGATMDDEQRQRLLDDLLRHLADPAVSVQVRSERCRRHTHIHTHVCRAGGGQRRADGARQRNAERRARRTARHAAQVSATRRAAVHRVDVHACGWRSALADVSVELQREELTARGVTINALTFMNNNAPVVAVILPGLNLPKGLAPFLTITIHVLSCVCVSSACACAFDARLQLWQRRATCERCRHDGAACADDDADRVGRLRHSALRVIVFLSFFLLDVLLIVLPWRSPLIRVLAGTHDDDDDVYTDSQLTLSSTQTNFHRQSRRRFCARCTRCCSSAPPRSSLL